MIIDVHTHIFPPDWFARRERLAAADPLFAEMYRPPTAKLADAALLIASMDQAGIDQAVVLGFCWRDPALLGEHNDYLLSAADQFPGRLLPFLALHLGDVKSAERERGRWPEWRVLGIGELRPEADGLDLRNRPSCNVLGGLASGLPLLIHASEPTGHLYPGKAGQSIAGLFTFLQERPAQRVLAAHLGGGLPWYALMPEVSAALTNLWVDTAAWPLLYEAAAIQRTVDILGSGRVLFGTDYPLRAQRRELRLLDRAGLSDAGRVDLLSGGALAFLTPPQV